MDNDTLVIPKQCQITEQESLELIAGLRYAAMLQQGILPKQRHFDRIFDESFVLYLPYQFISGDFYWLAELDGLIYLAVGDCMGHGVSAAMLSVLANNLLDYAVLKKRIKRTNRILKEFDARFLESFSSIDTTKEFNNDWIEIALCCIDRKNKTVFFSGAHRSITLLTKDKTEVYKGNHYPIGGWQLLPSRNFDTVCLSYNEGDNLYLYSDGFQDQIGGADLKRYKKSNFFKTLKRISGNSMTSQKLILQDEFNSWKGVNPNTDDVCIVGIKL
jgi:serine phosphatase RsbU (regulator of sigma subunit)